MKHKLGFGLVLAVALAGCSKKEPVADVPPESPEAVSNSILPAAMATPEPAAPAAAPVAATPAGPATLADLSTDQMTAGLKEALSKGVQEAIAQLGTDGGFLSNVAVRITMPENLQMMENVARRLGEGHLVDEFEATMNHAAEQAVPAAANVFADGVKQMSVADARGILTGPDDAATQYFKRTTSDTLREKFLPIVKDATAKAGVTAAYKKLTVKVSTKSPFLDMQSIDIDSYVTDQALDGLFKLVADEEKKIRANPAGQATDLLKSVFGAIKK